MKEFIEKLIGRLESVKEHWDRDDFHYERDIVNLDDVEDIANQLAEEYNNGHFGCNSNGEHEKCRNCELDCKQRNQIWFGVKEEYINTSTDTSSGWVACSERLPDIEGNTSDTVLVCTIDGFQHMAFWCADEKWRYCASGMIKEPMEWTKIIAWMPLPAPYKAGD